MVEIPEISATKIAKRGMKNMEALKWAVVTESQFTTAKHCVTCFDSKKEAIDWMNEEADAGNNAEVMLTSKALEMYPDCVIQ